MIGSLRHRLSLQQAVRTPDAGGGADIVWTDIATVWAALNAVGGGERDVSDRVAAQSRYKVRIRYRAGLTPGMRFSDGERLFNIQAVLDEDGRRRWLTCICEAGGAA